MSTEAITVLIDLVFLAHALARYTVACITVFTISISKASKLMVLFLDRDKWGIGLNRSIGCLTTLFEPREPLGHSRRLPFLRVERRWRDVETKTDQRRNKGGEVGAGEKMTEDRVLQVSTLQD